MELLEDDRQNKASLLVYKTWMDSGKDEEEYSIASQTMKKMIYFLKKKKKVVEISNSITADAVPVPPRNIPHYIPKIPHLYDNFEVSCSVNNNISESNSLSNAIQNGISEETIHLNGYDENQNDEVSQPVEEEVMRSSENDLATEVEQLPVLCLSLESGTVSDSDSNRSNTTNDLNIRPKENVSGNNLLDNAAVGELNKAIQKLSSEFKTRGINGGKKSNGNTYVINISNSTHFHIGSQKTINYPGADNTSNEKSQLELTDIRARKLLPLNDSQVLDIKDTLSEDDMLQISLSVREKWKDFARNLGMDKTTIRELEDLNDNDYNLVVYDILRQYLNRFPNTTVGFMIDVLKKSNEMEAIDKLLQNR